MRVLYCNIALIRRSGTEVVTIETALGLQRRGCEVAVLVGIKGPTAAILERNGISVVDDPRSVPWQPDVVHSNHLIQSIDAAAYFPDSPQIFMCHDGTTWHSQPPPLSVVRHWIAVDDLTEARLRPIAEAHGGSVDRLGNSVDLDRFSKRNPLPETPKRALLLAKNSEHLDAVREACANKKISLDELGPGVGRIVDDLHKRLGRYDIVFATGRMALEAIVSGCAVVVIDGRGLAGMATMGLAATWREQNFGLALLTRPLLPENVEGELDRYDAADASVLSDWLRNQAALEDYLGALCGYYEKAIADFASAPTGPRTTLADLPLALRQLLTNRSPESCDQMPLDQAIERLFSFEAALAISEKDRADRLDVINRLDAIARELKLKNTQLREQLEHKNEQLKSTRETIKQLQKNTKSRLQALLVSVAHTPARWTKRLASKLR